MELVKLLEKKAHLISRNHQPNLQPMTTLKRKVFHSNLPNVVNTSNVHVQSPKEFGTVVGSWGQMYSHISYTITVYVTHLCYQPVDICI